MNALSAAMRALQIALGALALLIGALGGVVVVAVLVNLVELLCTAGLPAQSARSPQPPSISSCSARLSGSTAPSSAAVKVEPVWILAPE